MIKEKAKIRATREVGAVGARAVREDGTRAKVQGIVDGIPARAVEAKVVHTQWISCGMTRAKIGAATMG